MIFRVTTTGIQIIPETPQDIAYVEHVLGLQNDSHSIGLFRVEAHDGLRLLHLETDTLGQGCFLCGNPMRGAETGTHQHCSAYEQATSDNLVQFTTAARGGNR